MKQYVGISRDHSGSMSSLSNTAMRDYNDTIQSVKTESHSNDIDTIVSVVSHQGKIVKEVVNSSVQQLKPLTSYPTPGPDTPLFDSVGQLVDMLQAAPDANKPDVSFLVIAVTDGYDNASRTWSGTRLGKKIQELQATDHWTFVFRVPRGNKRDLERLGVPSGNIQEWEQTERGMRESTARTQSAISNYYTGIKHGRTATRSFYTDLSGVSTGLVSSVMNDISSEVKITPVRHRDVICNYVPVKGTGFYQLAKPEKIVQDYKLILVRNKQTGAVYAGRNARDLLNLPHTGNISIRPGDHGDWDIFVQSTSTNRILPANTSILIWRNARSV